MREQRRRATVARSKIGRVFDAIGEAAAIAIDADITEIKFTTNRRLKDLEERTRALAAIVDRDTARKEWLERRLDEIDGLLAEAGRRADRLGCDDRVLVWGG